MGRHPKRRHEPTPEPFHDDEPPTLEMVVGAGTLPDPDATGPYDMTELASLLAVCLTLGRP